MNYYIPSDNQIEKALLKPGFGVVEVISQCPTQYGKLNRLGSAVDMMQWQKENAITVKKARKMEPQAREGKIIIGVLVDKELPIYQDEYKKVQARAKGMFPSDDS